MSASEDGRWYGADDRWPRHTDSAFRGALDKARRAGWLFRESTGHGFGRVYCRPPSDGEYCMVTVYSTGRGRENVARDLAKRVDHCRHLSLADSAALGGAERYLDRAEQLIAAAEGLLAKAAMEDRLTEALARAEELLDSANEHVAEFDTLVEAAKNYDDGVRVVAAEVRVVLQSLDVDANIGSATLLEQAEEATNEASEQAKLVVRATASDAVKRRIATVRRQIAAIRSNRTF